MNDLVAPAECSRSTPSMYSPCDQRETSHNAECSPNVDPPYPVRGGIFREEAIMLLRRFYVKENEKGRDLYKESKCNALIPS